MHVTGHGRQRKTAGREIEASNARVLRDSLGLPQTQSVYAINRRTKTKNEPQARIKGNRDQSTSGQTNVRHLTKASRSGPQDVGIKDHQGRIIHQHNPKQRKNEGRTEMWLSCTTLCIVPSPNDEGGRHSWCNAKDKSYAESW
ncbi:hypothetical protein GSI_13779 [Ganoderma sinense ZZ0214-1]|uniref:Uncharacterized protein n=1 Tax=Ganoderma sinense ZZ0214-1 TaxID=1077348 RepID=A0A2G8RRR8_9APHY|nr:hypothetical protein GSI_13779 [Ganoderma sinense ZZ0214-1]